MQTLMTEMKSCIPPFKAAKEFPHALA